MIEKWSDYDKNATGFISPEDLAFLLYELPAPLGRANRIGNGNDDVISKFTGLISCRTERL